MLVGLYKTVILSLVNAKFAFIVVMSGHISKCLNSLIRHVIEKCLMSDHNF